MQSRIRCVNWGMLLVSAMILAFPIPASSSLGDDVGSVQADKARMKGVQRTTSAELYTVHEIRASNGTIVREYASSAGKVFAVAWQGPFLPDFSHILGGYSGRFSQASQARSKNRPRVRGPLVVREPGLVVHSGGRMRAYFGRAYIPDQVPTGMNIEEIR
jgi:Protein of unknown function (DUF2844)